MANVGGPGEAGRQPRSRSGRRGRDAGPPPPPPRGAFGGPPNGGGRSLPPSGPPPRRRRSFFGALVYWGVVLGVWGLIFGVVFLAVFARGLPDTSKLASIRRQPSITYLDRTGAVLSVRGSQAAPPVDVDRLPPYVPAAFVSIEDRRFYQHIGVDPIGIGRAIGSNIRHGRTREGASTITQQLARNLFLTPDQNLKRKVQEALLAVWLERKFSKKEILGLYLSRVYFGAGAYGIDAAAQRYFNKPAARLSIGEAALLAGLLKSPTHYSPIGDQERAGRRATIVLNSMVTNHAITPEQRDAAFASKVRVTPTLANAYALYFVDWVDGQVRRLLGDKPEDVNRDLIVETTLDLGLDVAAQNAARTVAARESRQGVRQAALVAMDGDGRVRAMIGGLNYADSQFNRAVDARRQAGSAWKPFVYLTAMEQGRTPDTTVVDEPLTIGNWSPKNYTGRYLGAITIQTALAQSINTVAARLADELGRDKVADAARRLGITTPIDTQPAMALGASSVKPIEMAQAYAAFANGGRRVEAYGIERVRTADGQVLFAHRQTGPVQAIGNPPLTYMNRMMRQVLASGTGTRAAVPGYDLAGKTGTTSDYRDAWFVGYTGNFVIAVWVGKDDNTPMRKVTGGAAPAEIWKAFMTTALPRVGAQAIPQGPNAPQPTPADEPLGDLLNRAGEEAPPAPTPETPPGPDDPAQQDTGGDRAGPAPPYRAPYPSQRDQGAPDGGPPRLPPPPPY